MSNPAPFFVKSCTIAEIGTGERARSLFGLREALLRVPIECIYYHFWGNRLSPRFTDPDFHNDFALWAHVALHDNYLAEKLNIIDPTQYPQLENLREDLVEIVETRIEDYAMLTLAEQDELFHFVRSSLIVFDTPWQINHPSELPQVFTSISPRSIFYHFIDARTRTQDRSDDFSIYLSAYGEAYRPLIEKIKSIDLYFLSLSVLKNELARIMQEFFSEESHV